MNFVKTLLFICLSMLITKNLIAFENKILFKVDKEIITSIDIFNQSRYLTTLNTDLKNFNNEEIFELSKNIIIREKIKKIKLERSNINLNIGEKNLNSYINAFYSPQGIYNLNDYKSFLNSIELNHDAMIEKLNIEIAWNRLIFEKFSSKLRINQDDLKKKIMKNKNKKISSYLLSEIVFEASNKSQIENRYQKIISDIKNFGFKKAAIINSNSNTSKNGGEIGWIEETSINNKILKEIKKLKINEFSKPIIIPDGFLIIIFKDKKYTEKTLEYNVDEELKKLIQINTNQQLNQYSKIYFNKIKNEVKINEY